MKAAIALPAPKTADTRAALVEHFKERGTIMIATEAGAEGINLQFCSLVINYDLPWNPQRIEQRIGRCHRYGQKHDVVVVNFVDRSNEADARVYQLLSQKFKLFEGVFGASDEVLGAIGSGVDFERRIAAIYQKLPRTRRNSQPFRRPPARTCQRDRRSDAQNTAASAGEFRRGSAGETAHPQPGQPGSAEQVRAPADGLEPHGVAGSCPLRYCRRGQWFCPAQPARWIRSRHWQPRTDSDGGAL
ncbi:helicase-related protein [Azotobacter vinelandii]